ncbi:gliding motility lipoprotein GldH [Mucilaginibacter boryungensis]|nr:gliding motility lipoprotein GldH [Mucilaginibacter boryungensis]
MAVAMKQAHKILLGLVALVGITAVTSCSDPNGIFDQNTPIVNHNWAYVNNITYNVKIDDPSIAYNLYFNLRVTGDYKYSNLFVLLHTTGPNQKPAVVRYELKLANLQGEWLGSGSGNLYSYQIPFEGKYHFPAKGVYRFEIEQNMRDNPLHEVSDVGLRVEKAQ